MILVKRNKKINLMDNSSRNKVWTKKIKNFSKSLKFKESLNLYKNNRNFIFRFSKSQKQKKNKIIIQKRSMFTKYSSILKGNNYYNSLGNKLYNKKDYSKGNGGDDPEKNRNNNDIGKGHYIDKIKIKLKKKIEENNIDSVNVDKEKSIIDKKGSYFINRKSGSIKKYKKPEAYEKLSKKSKEDCDNIWKHNGIYIKMKNNEENMFVKTRNRYGLEVKNIQIRKKKDSIDEEEEIVEIVEEPREINVMINYMNGLEVLDSNIIRLIHSYYVMIATLKEQVNVLSKNNMCKEDLNHFQEFRSENFQVYEELNNIVLNLVRGLNFEEFRVAVGVDILSNYTDADLANILLFIIGLRLVRGGTIANDIYYRVIHIEENREYYDRIEDYNFAENDNMHRYLEDGTGVINIETLLWLLNEDMLINSFEKYNNNNEVLYRVGLYDDLDLYNIYINECGSDINKFIEYIDNIINKVINE